MALIREARRLDTDLLRYPRHLHHSRQHFFHASCMMAARKLNGQCILLVYGEIDLFVVQLQDALDDADAESVIARAPADALIQLKRFDFDAALINYTPGLDAEHHALLRALGGVPALLLCAASPPVSFLTALPILVKPVAAVAVVATLARLRCP